MVHTIILPFFFYVYSKYTWLYLLHHKSQVITVFESFENFSEKKTGFQLKYIQTNNSKEFLCLKSFLDEHRINHRLTCPYILISRMDVLNENIVTSHTLV